MTSKIQEICSEEIRKRLRKYDVVEILTERQYVESILSNVETHIIEKEERTAKVSALDILKEIFDQKERAPFDLYYAMNGGQFMHGTIDKNVPEVIRDIYKSSMDNLKMLMEPAWWIYEKDVLRAVAYHEYVSGFRLKEEEIMDKMPQYDQEEYRNIPIDSKILIGQGGLSYYAFPQVGGGIMDKKKLNEKDGKFKYIFKREKEEFDSSGEFARRKEKGINYQTLKQGIEEISKKSMSGADIWFFKNVLDPELLLSVYLAIKDTNIRQSDYKLIWILCKCKCPSVRLYLFEAIRPCYVYTRNLVTPNEDYINFILEKLGYLIRDINHIFLKIVNAAAVCFERFEVTSEEIIKSNSKLYKSFQIGDDFSFIYTGTIKINGQVMADDGFKYFRNHDEKGGKEINTQKVYYEYMPDKVSPSISKIAYSIITALHEQWDRSEIENKEKAVLYESVIEWQEGYSSRLFSHLKGSL